MRGSAGILTAKRSESFPLVVHYTTVSLLATVVIGLVLTYAVAWELRRDLDSKAKEQAVRVVRHLQQDIASDVLDPLGGAVDFGRVEHRTRLDSVVRRVASAFGIPEINIFDREGRVLYSTDPEHLRELTSTGNELFHAALAGKVSSAARAPGAARDIDDEARPIALLETYVPVASLSDSTHGGPPTFVIETYQDIDEFQAQVGVAQRRVALATLLSGAVLFLVLLAAVRRAARIIRAQTDSLHESNRRLLELSRDLEQQVAIRTQELLRRESLASLGTLAAGLAHEVNNPLATICTCAQALQARLSARSADPDPERARHLGYLQTIEDEAFRVKGITSSLLEFSRQTGPNGGDSLDAMELVGRTAELISVGDRLRGIEHDMSALRGMRVHGDATIFRQLVFNVLTNAIDAIRERERAGVAGYRGRIVWKATRHGERVVLVCSDNGIGFEPHLAGDLMAPFFTTKEPGRGTGLGLSLCHSMVERMGGQIAISSSGVHRGAEVALTMKAGATDGELGG